MSFGDLWNRTLVYFGIAEEDEDYYDDEEVLTRRGVARAELPRAAERAPADAAAPLAGLRRLDGVRGGRARRAAPAPAPAAPRRGPRGSRHIEAVPNPNAVRVHLVLPRSFNDAQQIADRFKQSIPVILNLQSADAELSKRLIDFASGLTYALERRHAAGRRQGVPAHAAKRRGQRRAARAAARARRLLQPGVANPGRRNPGSPNAAAMVLDAVSTVELFVDVFIGVYMLGSCSCTCCSSWFRLPYSLSRSSASCTTSASRTCGSGGGSCRSVGPLDLSPIVGDLRADRPARGDRDALLDRLH